MIKPFAIYFRIRGNILNRKSTPRYRRHGRVAKKAFTCCCNWPTKLIMNLLYRSLLPLSEEQVEALPMLASKEVKGMKQMPTTAKKSYYFYH
jgi:hypothetical protein